MLGKLNDKYHITFFTNTVSNAAVLCTISVLVCFTSPYEIWKEIVLLVTAACRPRWECSTNPMRGREENLKYSVPLDLSQILLGLFREWTCVYMVQGQQMYKDGWFSKHSQRQSQKQVIPAAAAAVRWLSVHRWASGRLLITSRAPVPVPFLSYTALTFEKSCIPFHTSAHKHGKRKDISVLCNEGEQHEP